MVTKTKSKTQVIIKEIKPRDEDAKYLGPEPVWAAQPEPEIRQTMMTKAFNWYNRFCDKKDFKEFLNHYLVINDREAEAKQIMRVDESAIVPTYGSVARMSLRGFVLSEKEQYQLNSEVVRLISTITVSKKETTEDDEVKSHRPNIQEIMRDKAREAGGEIDGMWDDFINAAAPTKFDYKFIDEVAKLNVLPAHIPLLMSGWKERAVEIYEAIEGKDAQLNEAYNHYSKTQLKAMAKFCEQVMAELESYITVKKTQKSPRKKKAVPVERIVQKLKFLKDFVDAEANLKLESISPTKLHGCSECYLYDTKTRKLTYLIADDLVKTLSVKNSSILGFDARKSQTKTLRKPATQLKEVMGSKPAGRKFFTDIKATGTVFAGRTNDRMIILKAW
jgi:hypothetical protein